MVRPRPLSRSGSRLPRIPSEEQLSKAGAQMRRIRSSRVNVDWLQGPGPADLWVWRELDSDRAEMVELTFLGRTVIMRGESLKTGRCEHGGGSPYAQELGLVELDAVTDLATVTAAIAILAGLPVELKSQPVHELMTLLEASRAAAADEGPNI